MFRTRLLSGIVLVLLLLAFIIPGGWILLGGLLAVSLIGEFEMVRVIHIQKSPLAVIGYVATILYYVNLYTAWITDQRFLILLPCMIMFFVLVLLYPKIAFADLAFAAFVYLYVGVMLGYIFLLRNDAYGMYLVWLIFLSSWGCDTCAYCVGMLCGKHKFAPLLSPKKSVEGAVGGVLGSALLGAVYAYIFRDVFAQLSVSVWMVAVTCGVTAVFSQIGDLAASAIKRQYDVKDYGKLIPGHGGIMDRFDSVIVAAPVIYYLIIFFGRISG